MKLLLVCLATAILVAAVVGPTASAQVQPEFRLGFKALAEQIPDVVGNAMENERWGSNGDSLQRTSRGLMVWRSADNWTAFTDGANTWINGPHGIQSRPNSLRFDWEPNELAVSPVSVASAPVYPPVIINGSQARDSNGPLVWKDGQICQDPSQGGTNCYTLAGGVLVKAGDRLYRWTGGTNFVDGGPIGLTPPVVSPPAPQPAPVYVPVPASVPQCAPSFSNRVDLAQGSTVTYNWEAKRGNRLLIDVTVWGNTQDVAVRLWSKGGTSLANVQIEGSGRAELVAPFDGLLHWDIRNSVWNSRETVEYSVAFCAS